MDALGSVIRWLDRRWGSAVALVASFGGGPSAARPGTVGAPAPARPRERREERHGDRIDVAARSQPSGSGRGPIPFGELEAAPRVHGDPATGGSASEPDAAVLHGAPARRSESPAEPTGAAAIGAHLDARRAQAAGLRALLLARQRRYAEAEIAFGQAATLDPGLDLRELAGFWDLERGAHEAAVRAYEAVGRGRDAALLRATLDGRYRPRLVRTA